jgi:hypothetical protein
MHLFRQSTVVQISQDGLGFSGYRTDVIRQKPRPLSGRAELGDVIMSSTPFIALSLLLLLGVGVFAILFSGRDNNDRVKGTDWDDNK